MEIIDEIENEDGTVTVVFDMSEKEINALVQYAVVDILEKECEKINSQPHSSDG